MSAAHTPGPWPIQYDNGDSRAEGEWFTVGPARVSFGYNDTDETKATAKADAALISASPAMLESLQKLVRWYGFRKNNGAEDDSLLPTHMQPPEICRAMCVIENAGGKIE